MNGQGAEPGDLAKRLSERRWWRTALLASLALAAAAFGCSFALPGPRLVARTVGLVTVPPTASGQPRNVSTRAGIVDGGPRDATLRFRFVPSQLVGSDTLVQTGLPYSGLTVHIVGPVQGNFNAVLVTSLGDQTPVSVVLVHHLRVGTAYDIRVAVQDGRSLSGWVDGRQQFTYSFPAAPVEPGLSGVVVGGGYDDVFPFHGRIESFRLSYRTLQSVGSVAGQHALWLVGGLALIAALVLLLVAVTNQRCVHRWLGLPSGKPRAPPGWWRAVVRRPAALAFVLLGVGVVLVAVATPFDNLVLQQSGFQRLHVPEASPGVKTFYSLAGEPKLFRKSASLDASLSFQVRVPVDLRPSRHVPTPLVSTITGYQGLAADLVWPNTLVIEVGRGTGPLGIASFVVLNAIPRGRWFLVAASVRNGQTFLAGADGPIAPIFTYDKPIFQATPTKVVVNGIKGVAVRRVTSTVTMYSNATAGWRVALVRAVQVAGVLALLAGAVLLSRRFLARLVPVATAVRRPLVLVTFGVLGAGVVVNLAVDWLHLQQTPTPYLGRNTWLFSQYPRFSDFFQVLDLLKGMNPYGPQAGSYPPFGYWLVAPVSWASAYAALFIFLAVMAGFLLWWLSRAFTSGLQLWERIAVVVVALMSLPVSWTFDRANVDLLLFAFLVFGIAALERRRGVLAAAWLGLFAAAKAVPIVYLFVFLRGRRLRYLFLGLTVMVVVSGLAILTFQGSPRSNIDGFRHALTALNSSFAGTTSTYFNASVYGWLQAIGYAIAGTHGLAAVHNAIAPYTDVVEVAAALALAAYLRWCERSLWRALTLITVLYLALSTLSYYYALIFLFVPLAVFVKSADLNRRTMAVGCLFGLALAPKAYFYLGNAVDVSVLFTAPLLLALGGAVIWDGIIDRRQAKDRPDFLTAGLLDPARY